MLKKNTAGHSIEHNNTQNLVLIGNMFNGSYASAGTSAPVPGAAGAGPACVIDIGNKWNNDLTPPMPTQPAVASDQVHFVAGPDGIRCRGLRLPIENIGDPRVYTIKSGSASGSVFANTESTGSTTITLPTAASGLSLSFVRARPFALRIRPAGRDAIRGAKPSTGLSLDSDGAAVTLVALGVGVWDIMSERGTVTVN